MISALRALGLGDDRRPGGAGPLEPVEDADAVRVADRDRLVELARSRVARAPEAVRQRAVERDLEHVERDDPRAALGGEPARDVHAPRRTAARR